MKYSNLILCGAFFWSQFSLAACMAVPVEQLQITVQSCETVEPRKHPKFANFFENVPNSNQVARLETSYTGALITAMGGKYFLQDSSLSACKTLHQGDRLNVSVNTACCDGGSDAPCILDTSKYISESELAQ